jgi:nifR3 family TIM-barrel protein
MISTPISIGSLKIANRTFAAPMAGLSLPAFRRLIMELGCGLTFSEMVSAEGVLYQNERTKRYYDNDIGVRPFGVQLFTDNPSALHAAIKAIDDESIDLFDINMGCPVKKVVKRGAGAALMRNPKRAAELIMAANRATDKPITVKLRAGWDKRSINCTDMARIVEEAGADAITIHPRTRSQEFSGEARWELISRVKEAVTIPVIGNGDIKTADDARAMMSETGCDAVMIGRAAYRNPWIFAGSPPPPPEVKKTLILRYVDLLCETHDEHLVIYAMRTFLSRFARGYSGVSKFLSTVHQVKSISVLRDAIQSFHFASVP